MVGGLRTAGNFLRLNDECIVLTDVWLWSDVYLYLNPHFHLVKYHN